MLLVVYYHVTAKCFDHLALSDQVLQGFRMAVFFMVSGFVAYKPLEYWTVRNSAVRLMGKIRSQVIPTVIFYCAFFYFVIDCNPVDYFVERGWMHYWFTIVLFEFFVVYYLTNLLTRNHPTANVVTLALLVMLSMVLFHLSDKSNPFCLYTKGYVATRQFPFFVLGTFIRKYYGFVTKRLDSWYVLVTLIVLYLIQLPVYIDPNFFPGKINGIVINWTIRGTGALAVFLFFFKLRDKFSATGRFSKCMSYIGRRTLDIYLIHFFLIMKVPALHASLQEWGLGSIERLVIVAVVLCVTCMCLAISYIIRKSKFLGKLLFVAK